MDAGGRFFVPEQAEAAAGLRFADLKELRKLLVLRYVETECPRMPYCRVHINMVAELQHGGWHAFGGAAVVGM